jgi:hypothetical protein
MPVLAITAGLTGFGVDALGLFQSGGPEQAEAWSTGTGWFVWRGGW